MRGQLEFLSVVGSKLRKVLIHLMLNLACLLAEVFNLVDLALLMNLAPDYLNPWKLTERLLHNQETALDSKESFLTNIKLSRV